MTTRAFENAMCEISEKYIIEAINYSKTASSFRPKRRLSIVLIAAILSLFLLGAGVVAVIYGDSIQSWFKLRWEQINGHSLDQEQMVVIDKLSQELGLSQTVNGVTVTVDSATVGSDVFYILVRAEATELAEGYNCTFEEMTITFAPESYGLAEKVGGLSWRTAEHDQNGNPLLVIDQQYAIIPETQDETEPLNITLTLSDLIRVSKDDELLCGGTWEFQISLDRSQIPEPISLPDTGATVTDYRMEETAYGRFTDIELTSTGISYKVRYENGGTIPFVHVLRLKNGMEVTGFAGNGSLMDDLETHHYSIQWHIPVDLNQVASVQIGDTEIPVS